MGESGAKPPPLLGGVLWRPCCWSWPSACWAAGNRRRGTDLVGAGGDDGGGRKRAGWIASQASRAAASVQHRVFPHDVLSTGSSWPSIPANRCRHSGRRAAAETAGRNGGNASVEGGNCPTCAGQREGSAALSPERRQAAAAVRESTSTAGCRGAERLERVQPPGPASLQRPPWRWASATTLPWCSWPPLLTWAGSRRPLLTVTEPDALGRQHDDGAGGALEKTVLRR